MTGFPKIYTAYADRAHIIRVAAAYDDQIALFSIPGDMIRWSKAEQEATFRGLGAPFSEQRYVRLLRHPTSNAQALIDSAVDTGVRPRFDELNLAWVDYVPLPPGGKPNVLLKNLWPIHIKGVEVGKLDDVRSLAVQEDKVAGLAVWAFTGSGVAKAWRVNDGRGSPSRSTYKTTVDGILYNV